MLCANCVLVRNLNGMLYLVKDIVSRIPNVYDCVRL